MKMVWSLAFSALFAPLALSQAAFAERSFSIAPYIEKCGGKIYSKCDSKELNQETIYKAALEDALKNKRDLMIVVGADWCPQCRNFSKLLAEDPKRDLLFNKMTIVELNGDLDSTKSLAQKLKFSYLAYPQVFILKSDSQEVSKMFYASSFSNLTELTAHLDIQETEKIDYSRPSSVGAVSVSTLEKSVELSDEYGTSSFYKNPKTLTEKFINQGFAAIHVFHYVDAYRAFYRAAKEDPNSVMARVGQVMAIIELDDQAEGLFYVDKALKEVVDILSRKEISTAEKAWSAYAASFVLYHARQYDSQARSSVLPIDQAAAQLIEADSENLDGLALVVWGLMPMLNINSAKAHFQNTLKAEPNSVAAHHYLLHIAEMESDGRAADYHAVILKDLAKGSAHAQHMYGHTLPQRGRWEEALAQFKKADQIHQEWAKNLGVSPLEDWHYSHNLDLMAATYLGMGDLKNAAQIWEIASEVDSRAVLHSVVVAIVGLDKEEAKKKLKSFEDISPEWKAYLQTYRAELDLTPETLRMQGATPIFKGTPFDQFVYEVKNTFLAGKAVDKNLSDRITGYFYDRFKAGGFDGWSNAYLEVLRMKRIAKILSMDSLLEDIKPLEFTIKTGSLCGSGEEQKSFAKCK